MQRVISETTYSRHVFEFNDDTEDTNQYYLSICDDYALYRQKIDFLAGDAPIIDEINLLKSYCYTFDDVDVNKFAIDEIKGRQRAILGLPKISIILFQKFQKKLIQK